MASIELEYVYSDLICCGNIFSDSGSPGLLQVLVVGPEDVDVVRLFGQLPNSLEGDPGVVLPAKATAGAELNLTAAAVALCFLKKRISFYI